MLVAPLNWGLGHATRCIPIIQALIKADYEPILASDGDALALLQKEFPLLKSYSLPPYNIKYSKNGKNLKWKLLLRMPSIILAIKREKKIVENLIEKESVSGIISDNRFGVVSKKIPSVYITHQINVLSGNTTFITSKFHQNCIRKFDECWVPDFEKDPNFSGILGHLENHQFNIKYIGILSRFKLVKMAIKYDLLILLSGAEPQRTFLENKVLSELKTHKGTVLFVRGVFNNENVITAPKNIEIVNYILTNELEKALNQSNTVIARSGYSTIMDLAVLGKKAFFIPTPGQFEQEYLAKILQEKSIAPYAVQENFTSSNLTLLPKYNGFVARETNVSLELFKLFQSK